MKKLKMQPCGLTRDEMQEILSSKQKEKFTEPRAEQPGAHKIHQLQDQIETWMEAMGEVILANNARLTEELYKPIADL